MHGFEYCNFQMQFRFIKKKKKWTQSPEQNQTTAFFRFFTFRDQGKMRTQFYKSPCVDNRNNNDVVK